MRTTKTFMDYLPSGDAEEDTVVLFNNSHIRQKPTATIVDVQAYSAPPLKQPKADSAHPLTSSGSVLLQTLPQYKNQFKFHLEQGHAIVEAGETKKKVVFKLIDEIRNILFASSLAVLNLTTHDRMLQTMCEGFFNDVFDPFKKESNELLEDVEASLARLREVELHPSLRTRDINTLLDTVDERTIRNWANNCRLKFDDLSKGASSIESKRELIEAAIVEARMEFAEAELSGIVQEIDSVLFKQTSIMEALGRDFNTACRLVDEFSKELTSPSKQPRSSPADSVSAMEIQSEAHRNDYLVQMRSNDQAIGDILLSVSTLRQRVVDHFGDKVRAVSNVQSIIQDMKSKLVTQGALVERVSSEFFTLKVIRMMPASYQVAAKEVARRRATRKLLLERSTAMANQFNELYAMEQKIRKDFHAEHWQYLPKGLLPYLRMTAPQVGVTLMDSDEKLPDIEPEDVGLSFEPPAALVDPLVAARAEATKNSAGGGVNPPGGDIAANSNATGSAVGSTGNAMSDKEHADWLRSAPSDDAEKIQRLEQEVETLRAENAFLQQSTQSTYSIAQSAVVGDSLLMSVQRRQSSDETQVAKLTAHAKALEMELQKYTKFEKENTVISGKLADAEKRLEEMKAELVSVCSEMEAERKRFSSLETEVTKKVTADVTDRITAEVTADVTARVTAEVTSEMYNKVTADVTARVTADLKANHEKELEDVRRDAAAGLKDAESNVQMLQKKLNECHLNSADLEHRLATALSELSSRGDQKMFALHSQVLLAENKRLEEEVGQLRLNEEKHRDEVENLHDMVDMWKQMCEYRISYVKFQVKDVALFYLDEHDNFVAFNRGAPYYFMSSVSAEIARRKAGIDGMVLGSIVHVEEHEARAVSI